jgi:hypothetical protein
MIFQLLYALKGCEPRSPVPKEYARATPIFLDVQNSNAFEITNINHQCNVVGIRTDSLLFQRR